MTTIHMRAIALARAACARLSSARERYRQRRDIAELLRLDDRTLADAGLTRAHILVFIACAEARAGNQWERSCKGEDVEGAAAPPARADEHPWRLAA
jgi:uncharacterized protein YjiS (DUF1127 family)